MLHHPLLVYTIIPCSNLWDTPAEREDRYVCVYVCLGDNGPTQSGWGSEGHLLYPRREEEGGIEGKDRQNVGEDNITKYADV